MRKGKFAGLFFAISCTLLLINIVLILIFSFVEVDVRFYNALNVPSLVTAFLSFIASSFFSFSVYLQTKNQNKINDSLPKKDDQYIISNYSLFNIENEFSLFSLNGYDKESLIRDRKYLKSYDSISEDCITRVVFLPTDSMNMPTYKVMVRAIEFVSGEGKTVLSCLTEQAVDGEYSANILRRNYNCICVDILEAMPKIKTILDESKKIKLYLDIISVFNVKMSVVFFIYRDKEKNTDENPDKKELPDLATYLIHHTNFSIEEKSILQSIE